MKLFSGKLVILVQSGRKPGKMVLKVSGKSLKSAEAEINSSK